MTAASAFPWPFPDLLCFSAQPFLPHPLLQLHIQAEPCGDGWGRMDRGHSIHLLPPSFLSTSPSCLTPGWAIGGEYFSGSHPHHTLSFGAVPALLQCLARSRIQHPAEILVLPARSVLAALRSRVSELPGLAASQERARGRGAGLGASLARPERCSAPAELPLEREESPGPTGPPLLRDFMEQGMQPVLRQRGGKLRESVQKWRDEFVPGET